MQKKYNTLHYIAAVLKAYGINTVIASPGTQNSCFNYMVQNDSFFRCFSVLDERSAAYTASGIAAESGKPAVITCTGATASRNYLSAMTECFYRKIPVIALTFIDAASNQFSLPPQYVDRSVSQNDVKALSVTLPEIREQQNIDECLAKLNAAMFEAVYKSMPVHINSASGFDFEAALMTLPEVWKTEYYDENFEFSDNEIKELQNKNTAVFIGAHCKFTKEETELISKFALNNGIPVMCSHTSNYTGANKVLISQFAGMHRFKEFPDIIIDIGNVSEDYSYVRFFRNAVLWRISKYAEFRNRNNRPLRKLFACTEKTFFKKAAEIKSTDCGYYGVVKKYIDAVKIPQLPLCNALICRELSEKLPKNSSLHVSILNSIRNMNFFNLDKSIAVTCNSGGFGIDGAVSSLIGQSFNDENRKCFGLIGDTAFFYDMNILGNRHIKNNVRILLVNNNRSAEFRLKMHVCEQKIGEKADCLIAAASHNGGGAQGWALSCGFHYMKAETKEEFLNQIEFFCLGECSKPVLFEVFTRLEDEQDGLSAMQNFNRNKIEEFLIKCYSKITR